MVGLIGSLQLDNSYVILMGDHGQRINVVCFYPTSVIYQNRQDRLRTWQGMRERSNPMLYISLPRNLR